MAKTIEIQNPSYLERHPVQIRRLLVRLIFSLGAQHGWEIVMHGQPWHEQSRVTLLAAHKEQYEMTDEHWRMLMGPASS
jgi:peptidoglycan/xylan/chitin deacetylase (PgdA/CDA1 family)